MTPQILEDEIIGRFTRSGENADWSAAWEWQPGQFISIFYYAGEAEAQAGLKLGRRAFALVRDEDETLRRYAGTKSSCFAQWRLERRAAD